VIVMEWAAPEQPAALSPGEWAKHRACHSGQVGAILDETTVETIQSGRLLF
jgi:hypothetical protein